VPGSVFDSPKQQGFFGTEALIKNVYLGKDLCSSHFGKDLCSSEYICLVSFAEKPWLKVLTLFTWLKVLFVDLL
jgi:hypothetical protein